ncbi:HD-GYP domain-containing protein [Bacillus sp. Marseille-P3661]|uniref:HD-GYP domain-containing protein n=1 Tax=Bacillus sp. Marseille-P3661 TaxID=1936234 RepID=UPI000C835C9B|nr:HD domain-containing phosphohydrolase [Bacillus sp. Marseille-P3661]
MRYSLIDNVKQSEILGQTIYTGDGRILLEKGVILTIGLISRLRQMGVNAIFLMDERFGDIKIEEVVSESTKREVMQSLAESVQYIQSGKDFNLKAISKTTEKIIDEIFQNQNVLTSLTDIRTNDNALFVHSINVCIMSVIVGFKMGLNRNEIKELAIGAIFHDIGKILKSPQSNTGEKMNDHTWLGFNLLRKKHEISTVSAHVALQHHENVDGSGWPRMITGDKIPLFAKIVAVTNFYDNQIAHLDGSIPVNPHVACEKIFALTNTYFDHQVVWTFLRSVAFYPTGRQVRLTTGETGVIVGQNQGLPQRPIIRIFEKYNQSKFDDYEVKEVDLGKKTTVFIKKIL